MDDALDAGRQRGAHQRHACPRRWRAASRRDRAPPAAVSTGDGFAVFQVTDIKPAHAPDFAEYKEHILDDYREQQLPQLLNAQLNKLDERAKQLNDLKKAAGELNIPVKTSELVGKDGQVPDLGAMSGPRRGGLHAAQGRHLRPHQRSAVVGVVLSVIDKQEPTPEEIAKNFAQMRDQLVDAQRERRSSASTWQPDREVREGRSDSLLSRSSLQPGRRLGN